MPILKIYLKSQINNLNFHLKGLEKEEQTNSSKQKEIIKIREEINELENRKPTTTKRLFCRNRQNDPKIHIEMQETQK